VDISSDLAGDSLIIKAGLSVNTARLEQTVTADAPSFMQQEAKFQAV